MNREQFQQRHGARWREFESALDALDAGKEPEEAARLPERFRQLCCDLALAQYRLYGVGLCDRLNRLVIRGYHHVYRRVDGGWARMFRFLWFTFPGRVRAESRLFWLSMALFWLPYISMTIAGSQDPRWLHALLGPEQMAMMDTMYGSDDTLHDARAEAGSSLRMFAFYIHNNVSIDFRIFAGGILAGLGTVFFLLFNGLYIGAAAGYVHYAGSPKAFYTFVCGHSSWELLGMVVAGMAGFKLGQAVIHPGRLSRREALVRQGKISIELLYGAAAFTFVAAIIEGFWSASPAPPLAKYIVGVLFWVLLAVYLWRGGRTHAA